MLTPNTTPRPYCIVYKLADGTLRSESIDAYDVHEAIMQGAYRLTAKGIAKDVSLVEAGPDMGKIREQAELARISLLAAMNSVREEVTSAVSVGKGRKHG